VRLPALPLAYQVGTRGDVAPLVAAAHLQLAALGLEQVPEVVRLDQHVAELGVRDPLGHPARHRLLLQHAPHPEVPSRVAQELHQREPSEPVGVVPEPGGVGTLEREKPLQLAHQRPGVSVDLVERHDRALGALAAGVTHHAGPTAHQRDGDMSLPLQPGHPHHGDKVADVQRVRRGIEPGVGRDRPPAQALGKLGSVLLDEAAGLEEVEKVAHRPVSYPLETGLATG
jgi:hypothetical protein